LTLDGFVSSSVEVVVISEEDLMDIRALSRRTAITVKPAALADAPRRHSAAHEREHVQHRLIKRAGHPDRAQQRPAASEPHIAGGIDGEAFMLA